MKRTYETFYELAEAMCEGEGILHLYNCVVNDDKFYGDHCIAWQTGVKDFAEWLDHIGIKVDIIDGKENFYQFMSKQHKK